MPKIKFFLLAILISVPLLIIPDASVSSQAVTLPDQTNTGIAGCPTLTPMSGLTITQDNRLIENADISGEVVVDANNVVLRCVRIRTGNLQGINNQNGGGTLVDRVEIDMQSASNCQGGITGGGYTLRRVNIHSCEDGAKVGSDVLIENSYIHDLNTNGSDPHYDGLQLMGCCSSSGSSFVTSNIIIRNNNIQPRPATATGTSSGATSSIIIKTDFGAIDDVLIDNNRLNCGAFTVYSRSGNNYPPPTNVRFTNNKFGRCYEFGLRSIDGTVTWTGNVWEDTGTAAPEDSSPPPPTQTFTPIYRLWNPKNGDHMNTTNSVERDWAVNTVGYVYQGITGYVATTNATGYTPIYRLWNPKNGDHMNTTNSTERDWAVNTVGFVYQGVTGYIKTAPGTGYTPIYRLWLGRNGDHMNTTNSTERDWAVSTVGYVYQGITGYVKTGP